MPDQWITLFPAGGELTLDTFGLEGDDLDHGVAAARRRSTGAGEAEVGDLLQVDGDDLYAHDARRHARGSTSSPRRSTRRSVPAQGRRYRTTSPPPRCPRRRPLDADAACPTPRGPTGPARQRRPAGQLCAQLDIPGGQPGVVLATTEPATRRVRGRRRRSTTSSRSVESGVGAFVQSGGWSTRAEPARCSSTPAATPTPSARGRRPTTSATPTSTPVVVPAGLARALRARRAADRRRGPLPADVRPRRRLLVTRARLRRRRARRRWSRPARWSSRRSARRTPPTRRRQLRRHQPDRQRREDAADRASAPLRRPPDRPGPGDRARSTVGDAEPGAGVRVAVVDSGVYNPGVRVDGGSGWRPSPRPEASSTTAPPWPA